MSDDNQKKTVQELLAENQRLTKRLRRIERRMITMDWLQNQNMNLLRALMTDLDYERERSETLLLNILPELIAHRLKSEPGVIADQFDSASVLFADIVGFTPLSQALSAQEMVTWLNEIYSAFDEFVQQREVEKIRTIGDNYMVASGVPSRREDHAIAITRLALDMRDYIDNLAPTKGHRANFRIGINSGPMVGGVIGTHKFQYDIWGDAVNTASRMESHGIPGQIQVTQSTYNLIRQEFDCENRGPIPVKGKGEMETYFVIGPK
ncbi:MAG: adenylate/guanylate cyclase domain-containing protein [Pseudomonadota bacterium]